METVTIPVFYLSKTVQQVLCDPVDIKFLFFLS